ncbi:two-component system sensor histidine kinase NtrB [Hyphococcus sp.]|jgi:two-component system sensor kinase FixL|uniref:two-component system sensor histidine kinase NtrB n=1 Tax=Hyphococcus sp. TaxID=2038636 RepID=UPI003D0BA627
MAASGVSNMQNERFLRSVINASPNAVITINETGEILIFSRMAQAMFGFSETEVLGKNVSMLMPEPDHSLHDGYMRRYLETGEAQIIGRARPVMARRKTGETFPAVLHVSEFDEDERIFVGFIEDVTRQKATERRLEDTQIQLQHAGRIGAMGEIATSIAHELNQPLTAAASMAGAVALTLKKTSFDGKEDALALIDDAVAEIRRASGVIRQMRDFLRNRETERAAHPVNRIVEESCLIALIGAETEGVMVASALDPHAGEAMVDRIQLQQVIVNLIRNAVDAMQETHNKRLTIATSKTGDSVEIRIADTGCGISAEMKKRLFEPFATTKEDGMGIGLSISKSIVEAHKGEIYAHDNHPAGTVFVVKLPILRDGAKEDA